jgi:hypothetical protein
MSDSVTSYAAALRVHYPAPLLAIEARRKDPFLLKVKTDKKFTGKYAEVPIQDEYGENISTTFSVANAASNGDNFEAPKIYRQKHYGVGSIENELILAGDKDGKATALNSLAHRTKSLILGMTSDLAFGVWNGYYCYDGTNHKWVNSARAYIASAPAVGGTYTTFTVPEVADLRKFRKGMTISWAAYGSPSTEIDHAKIHAIDVSTRTITIENATTTNPAQYNILYRYGDYTRGATSTISGCGLHGVTDWIPMTAPSSTVADFTGVIRGTSPALSGLRYDGTGASSIKSALLEGIAVAQTVGDGVQAFAFMNSADFAELAREVEGSVDRGDSFTGKIPGSKSATVGFGSLFISTDMGTIEVVGSPYVPKNYAWVLDMNTWVLSHSPNSGMPGFIHKPGSANDIFIPDPSSDAYKWRMGWYGDLICTTPGNNVCIALP